MEYINFKTLSTKKYLVNITSNMLLNGMMSETEVELRWMLTLKEIGSHDYTFELITLDHRMVKADNMGYIEIHKVVSQLQKALNEITFTVDKQGTLLRVKNLEQIKERWEDVKAETIEYNKANTSLVELFKIQDEAFEKVGGVDAMVKAMEFFDIYLNNIYGRDFFGRIKKNIPNLFRSGLIPFALGYDGNKSPDAENIYTIKVDGYPNIVAENHLKDLYGGFPISDFDALKPVYLYNAQYNIDLLSGFIIDGEVNFSEAINDKFGGEVHYKIRLYE
ncbi:hypothetical protein IVN40_05485 [Chryseobacterium indologenes]|uniref:Uncharacterized protein n=3 Tax=Chryseobacterium TaxID=59732 RepID=A0A1M5KX44_9FLAO|nr:MULTISPECIES: hypothetical protein [Bacteroidota]KMQ64421.1 hypothetical protein ACM46_09090 [Chryseobacterium angstadtii]MBF6643635.1 hypothetical protein [Chryseobacterium indologenes]SFI56881.1 hypothetical protein SAMN05421692_0116 [Chryseobacterium indologenes]SHG57341.1 hypothetical protein SAMN05421866_0870 [Chryseobacterium oranimense]SUX50669.1 Uncharacterised protein [Chryseobacterium indologenes]